MESPEMISLATLRQIIDWSKEIPEIFWIEDGPFDAKWDIIALYDADVMLPSIQGIYAIGASDSDEVLYIGKSKNLCQRFRAGHHKTIKFIQFNESWLCYIELPDVSRGGLSNLETYYIRKHKPLLQG